MSNLYGTLIDWWRRHRWSTPRIANVRRYDAASAMPARLPRRQIAVAGTPPTWAALECPCGHGHRLMVRIRPHDRMHTWQITEQESGPSMQPSIDSVTDQRRCHFWLRDGRVHWVDDNAARGGGTARRRRKSASHLNPSSNEGR